MVSIARVSVFGPDRVGFVAAIADYLFSAGVSLGDTTFAALGSGAEFVALCDLPDGMTPNSIQAGLRQLPELAGAEIQAVPYAFDPNSGFAGKVTHRITISGGNKWDSSPGSQRSLNNTRRTSSGWKPASSVGLETFTQLDCSQHPQRKIEPVHRNCGQHRRSLGLSWQVEENSV